MKYLLYIDILGFSAMASESYLKINKLFKKIDELNVHKDPAYQTLIFSDTVLIFNRWKPAKREHHKQIVMFLCEFAQDLMFRCLDLEIQFRAILTYDKFFYKERVNFQSFHGKALIDAYYKEKEINAMGLFIVKKLLKYMFVFKHQSFDKDLDFVFLTQNLEEIAYLCNQNLPIEPYILEPLLYFPDFKNEIKALEIINSNMLLQTDSKIRGKYLQTYHFYKTRYKYLLEFLEINKFNAESILTIPKWFDMPVKESTSSKNKRRSKI